MPLLAHYLNIGSAVVQDEPRRPNQVLHWQQGTKHVAQDHNYWLHYVALDYFLHLRCWWSQGLDCARKFQPIFFNLVQSLRAVICISTYYPSPFIIITMWWYVAHTSITGNIAWNQRPKGNVDFRSKFPNINNCTYNKLTNSFLVFNNVLYYYCVIFNLFLLTERRESSSSRWYYSHRLRKVLHSSRNSSLRWL